ncbi:MAG: cyclic nucleotide-binding domain-containing protein [Deltaproteobacteria bacterium]|nr:cyclic nucleotide-binding domain-containing protein [Deltaproteobacteria bacterium]
MTLFGKPVSAVGGGSPLVPANLAASIRGRLQHGDLDGAARLYLEGRGTLGPLLYRAFDELTPPEQQALAQLFAHTRDYAYAAPAFERLGRRAEAAALYEHAGEYVLAANCHEATGNLLAAGAAWERAGKPAQALALYERARAPDAALQCLVRQERFFDAALLCRRLGKTAAEVDLLYRVHTASPQRVAAVYRLAELMEQHGHADQALAAMVETLQHVPSAAFEASFCQRLLALAQARGRADVVEECTRLIGAVRQREGQPARAGDSSEMRSVMDHHNIAMAEELQRPRPPELAAATVLPVDPFAGLVRRGAPPEAPPPGLATVSLLGELSFSDLQLLQRHCVPVSYAAGAVIMEQGAPGAGLLVLERGRVQVLQMGTQPPRELATLGPGETLGELSFVDGAPTSARVVALEPTRALLVPGHVLGDFLATRDAAAVRVYRALLRTLVGRLRAANLRVT